MVGVHQLAVGEGRAAAGRSTAVGQDARPVSGSFLGQCEFNRRRAMVCAGADDGDHRRMEQRSLHLVDHSFG